MPPWPLAVLSRVNSTMHLTYSYDPDINFKGAPGGKEIPVGMEDAVKALAERMAGEKAGPAEIAAAFRDLLRKF